MPAKPAPMTSLPIDPHLLTVACPWRGADVPFDACRACDRCWLVHLGQDRAGSFVVCEKVPADPPARAAAPITEARVTSVASIMTRSVISVRRELSIERLIMLLIDEDISATPVVDRAGQLIGLVSRDDLLTDDYDWADLRDDFLTWSTGSERDSPEGLFAPELLRSRTVADVMTPHAVTLAAAASIAEAAAALDSNRVPEAVVLDDRGAIAGVVSKSDIVRWIGGAAD